MILPLIVMLFVSACTSPCFTAGDIETRSDCGSFDQVMVSR